MYDVALKNYSCQQIQGMPLFLHPKKIMSRQIVTNENDSHVVNSDPLFQLFSTALFDHLNESIEKMLQQLDSVPESKSDGVNSEKVATFLTKRN